MKSRPKLSQKREVNGLAPAHLLNSAQWRWIEEFLLSHDIERASTAAGYAKSTDLRGQPAVRNALQQAQIFRSARTAIHSDMILRRWWMLATADVNELVELRITPCRRCWGLGYQFQFRDHELGEAQQAHDEAMLKLDPHLRREFDELGGPGYTTKRPPNPDCPACDGDGEPLAVFKDTRYLSASARVLYNGVERTRGAGIKLLMRDRGFAETMLAKHLGLLPTGHKRTLKIDEMSEDELEEFLTVNGVSIYVADDGAHAPDDDSGAARDGLEAVRREGDDVSPEPVDPEESGGVE